MSDIKSSPSIAFATICKNEEHIILKTLKSIEKIVDYIIVVDTGSTDSTVKIVQDFLDSTNIPGEIYQVDWVSFGYNKTQMMELVFGKTDYVLSFDADDELMPGFYFTADDAGNDLYYMRMERSKVSFLATVIYNNRVRWKFCGVAHTTIKCLDKENLSYGYLLDRGYVSVETVGSRSFDPYKYLKDAEKLKAQFWDTLLDDPDDLNSRSVFYTAQSYLDQGMYKEALQWNKLYTNLKYTWIEEMFEAQMRIAGCMIALDYKFECIYEEMIKAAEIFPDRAEPHFKIGKYLNDIKEFELAYKHLKIAQSTDFVNVQKKYSLFVNYRCYGKYVLDELSVSCYWLGKFTEGINYLEQILYDEEMKDMRPRLAQNHKYFTAMIFQDSIIGEVFGTEFKGVYIDVGSAYPIVRNTSYYFECLGWETYCIEPNVELYEMSKDFRKNNYNFACGFENKELVDFTVCTLNNGNQEAISCLHIDERLIEEHKSYEPTFKKIKVKLRTLNDFIDETDIKTVDILKIDTEGTELDVLLGFDVNKYSPKLLIIENNYDDNTIECYLENFAYKKLRRVGVNDYYTKQ